MYLVNIIIIDSKVPFSNRMIAEKYTKIILSDRQGTKRKMIHKTGQKFKKC